MSVQLTYETYGNSNDSAIILIHPFPFRAQFWSALAPTLADAGYFVVAPNLRGCATSPLGDEDASMDVLADDVWRLADSLGVVQPFIMGVSLGGYVTLAMLRARPDGVAGLGLIDTKATADSPAAVRNRRRIASEIRSELSVSEYAEQMLPTLLSAHTHEHRLEVVQDVRQWISSSDAHTVAWLQEAMAARPDSSAELARFAGNVLLIRGADDVVSKPEDFELMVSVAQHPTFVEIPDCGHLPPVEDPVTTSAVVVTWLQGNS